LILNTHPESPHSETIWKTCSPANLLRLERKERHAGIYALLNASKPTSRTQMYLGSMSTCFIRRLKEHGTNTPTNRRYIAAREAIAWEHWSKGVLIDLGKGFEHLPISVMMVNAMEVALNVILDATGELGLNRNVTGKKELKNGWNFRCASDGPPRFLDLSSGTVRLYQSIQPPWWWCDTWIKLSVATVQG
jgi:hypothetical protein